jgi:cytochrome c peroxidase
VLIRFLILCLIAVFLTACGTASKAPEPAVKPRPIGAVMEIKAPLGLPPVPMPADNPATAETIALGRRLYYDTILSKDSTISCATCHSPALGFSDGQPVSTGIGKQKGGRNAPTVINSAYNTFQFWDGRAASLEEQAAGPMQNPIEMGHSIDGINNLLANNAAYKADFEKAFGPGPATFEKVTMAIAAFERTVLAGNSPFDKYMYGGDRKAMSPAAIRGLEVFRNPQKGNCAVCHTIEKDHALFTDNKFHNLGVGMDSKGELKDLGRYEVTKREEDKGAFKTPTLRNIARTAPYMHDGSLKTLKEVVDFYVGGGNSNPHLDKEIKSLEHLSKQDREDLVAFMEALTGEFPYEVGPPAKSAQAAGVQ